MIGVAVETVALNGGEGSAVTYPKCLALLGLHVELPISPRRAIDLLRCSLSERRYHPPLGRLLRRRRRLLSLRRFRSLRLRSLLLLVSRSEESAFWRFFLSLVKPLQCRSGCL